MSKMKVSPRQKMAQRNPIRFMKKKTCVIRKMLIPLGKWNEDYEEEEYFVTRQLRARQLRADTYAPTFTRTTQTRATLAREIKMFIFIRDIVRKVKDKK